MKKEYITRSTFTLPKNEQNEIHKMLAKIEEEEKDPNFYNNFKVVENPDYETEYIVIIETDNLVDIKNELRAEIIKRGYKSVDSFAKHILEENKNFKYSIGTIKMSLTPNHKTSIDVLNGISHVLGFEMKNIYQLEKKINTIKQKKIGI